MPVTLTIKQVPDQIAQGLRARAAKHHRSLQGELMFIIEQAALAQGSEALGAPWNTGVAGSADGLLDELDSIMAGSEWGSASVLSRAQANERSSGKAQ